MIWLQRSDPICEKSDSTVTTEGGSKTNSFHHHKQKHPPIECKGISAAIVSSEPNTQTPLFQCSITEVLKFYSDFISCDIVQIEQYHYYGNTELS